MSTGQSKEYKYYTAMNQTRLFPLLLRVSCENNHQASYYYEQDYSPFIGNSPAGFWKSDLGRIKDQKPNLNYKKLGLGSALPHSLPGHTCPNFVKPGWISISLFLDFSGLKCDKE